MSKKLRNAEWVGLILATVANLFIFFNRSRFEYRSYRSPGDLYGTCGATCRAQWRAYVKDYPEGERKEALQIPGATGDTAAGTPAAIRQLGNFLLAQFDDQRGVPSQRLQTRSPLEQYRLLESDSAEKLWCGNWSNIFAWMAWSRGITTRIVEIEKPGDHHVFNECYVPEWKSWVLVDLTNKIILPPAQEGGYHNGYSYAKSGPPPAARIYFDTAYRWLYYRRYHLPSVYSTPSRVRRYLLPEPWYDQLHLEGSPPGNVLFYVKQGFVLAWILFLVMVIRRGFARRRQKSNA